MAPLLFTVTFITATEDGGERSQIETLFSLEPDNGTVTCERVEDYVRDVLIPALRLEFVIIESWSFRLVSAPNEGGHPIS